MSYRIASIKLCASCPFGICVHNELIKEKFRFMCGFKKIWYPIPVSIFLSVWLEMRGKL